MVSSKFYDISNEEDIYFKLYHSKPKLYNVLKKITTDIPLHSSPCTAVRSPQAFGKTEECDGDSLLLL